jgi:hypothetical protein
MTSAQVVLHVLRSDCQQISAHPSERNASWMCMVNCKFLSISWVFARLCPVSL